jgi:hypothetical protein
MAGEPLGFAAMSLAAGARAPLAVVLVASLSACAAPRPPEASPAAAAQPPAPAASPPSAAEAKAFVDERTPS